MPSFSLYVARVSSPARRIPPPPSSIPSDPIFHQTSCVFIPSPHPSLLQAFQQQMQEVMENLEAGELAFDDLGSLLEGNEGFDLARGTWRKSGWRELKELRKVRGS